MVWTPTNELWKPRPINPEGTVWQPGEIVHSVDLDGGDGKFYAAGCRSRARPVGGVLPVMGDKVPLVTEANWYEMPNVRHACRVGINQESTPACCLASLANAFMIWMFLNGWPAKKLDWRRAWKLLSGGRGGVALDDAAEFVRETGYPVEGGGVVKLLEGWDITTLEGLASALFNGCICTFGHDVHAECASRLTTGQDRRGRKIWMLDTRNSWGEGWGDNGWHLFPLSDVEISTYGVIGVRELAFDPAAVYPDV